MSTSTSKRRKNRVCGAYPPTLFRCFDKKEYAEQFAHEGKIRVRLLDDYRYIECNARRDDSEGIGQYQLKGPVVVGRVSRNPEIPTEWLQTEGFQQHQTEVNQAVFPLCCSHASVDLVMLKKKFGLYAVKIVSPVSLAIDLDFALNGEHGTEGPFLVHGTDVEYNKGEPITDGRESKELADLAYMQKPARFAPENEFRFCLIGLGEKHISHLNTQRYLDINLGVQPYYLQLLPD